MKKFLFKTFKKLTLFQISLVIFYFPGISGAIQDLYTFDESIYTDGIVRVVRIFDSILYVGGEFSRVYDQKGSHSRQGLAAINLSTRLVTDFKADIDYGTVRSICLLNDVLYAGGTFTSINSVSRSKIAAVNSVSGNVIETFSKDGASINGSVFAVACLEKKLYAGGNFTIVNGIERNYLVAFDAATGEVDTSINPSPCDSMDYDGKMGGGVFALEIFKPDIATPGILFAGGNYKTICGIHGKQFLTALNSDGTPGPEFDKKISQAVDAMECKDSTLYIGYAGYGNRPAAYKINKEECRELWKGYVVNGDVQAVTCSENDFLFFSFHQGLYDTLDLYRCAVINASNGKPYDVLPSMSSFFGVFSLDSYKKHLAAGGTFRRIGEKKHTYLAIFDIPPYPLKSPPPKIILKSPADDSIIQSRSVTLRWLFGCKADSFEVQIATDYFFDKKLENITGITSHERKYSDLKSATKYYWRVRGLNQWGNGEWSDYLSFMTPPGENEIPDILSPSDRDDHVETTFRCIWNSEEKAESYRLQVSSQLSFDSTILDTIVESDTTVLISGLSNNTKCYLQVQSITAGGASDWKTIEFTTVMKSLSLPSAIYPQDGMNNIATTVLLKWRSDIDAELFNLQVFADSALQNIIYTINNIEDAAYVIHKLEYNTRYFWRLQALSQAGKSDWSRLWQFITIPGSNNMPMIISPENNAQNQALPVVCQWHRVSDASMYLIQVSKDQDFDVCINDVSDFKDTLFVINNLENDESYYIRVRALVSGGLSEWTYCNFKTIQNIPRRPLLIIPADKNDQVEINPLCVWSHDQDTRVYNIQLSSERTFSTLLIDSIVSDTSCTINNLKYETEYYIRIRAINEAGQAWSLHSSFTTMCPLPDNPVLLYPCFPVNVAKDTVLFLWSSSQPYVDKYRIEIGYDSSMRDMIHSSITADTSFLMEGCKDQSKIFWKVQAINRTGAGKFSPAAVFTTDFLKDTRFFFQRILQAENFQAITYFIGKQSNIRIELFNLRGACVWQFKNNFELPGSYLKKIDVRLQPGKYILRFKAGTHLENRDVIILQ